RPAAHTQSRTQPTTRFAACGISFAPQLRFHVAAIQRHKATATTLIARNVDLDNLEFETSAFRAVFAHNPAGAITSGTRNRGGASQHAGATAGFACHHCMLGIFGTVVAAHAAHST